MSLQELVSEHRQLKSDFDALSRRLDQNESRIAQLTNGGGRGGYPAAATPTYAAPPQTYAAPAVYAAPTYATSPMAQSSKLGSSKSANKAGIGIAKQQLEGALAQAASTSQEVWEEPPQAKVSPSEIDRCEEFLRQAFMKHPVLSKKATTNPLQAMQTLLGSLDTNHSGKLDESEFKEICRQLGFDASASALTGLFHRYDLDRSGNLTKEEFGKLILKEGGGDVKAKKAIARMREVLSLRAGGFPTMKAMGSQFRIIDRDRSGKLSKDEFNIALDCLFKAYKVTFTVTEKNELFTFFDRDGGGVNYDEYIRSVRGDMNDFRTGWVLKAFDIMDKDGSGIIDLQDLTAAYDVSQNPAVQSGKQTPTEAYQVFLNNYDKSGDGKVTKEEFIESYQWVSASIDNDDYFELMMRNAWHISGGDGWCQNTSNLRILVIHFDDSQEVVEIIDDLGLNKNDYQAVMKKLAAQGVKNVKAFKLAT